MLKRECAEVEAWKAAEVLREAMEFADVANAARVSAEGEIKTLQTTVVEAQRELEEAQALEGALRSECQQLATHALEVARITFDAIRKLGARCPPLPL